jgi:hypothetical protein
MTYITGTISSSNAPSDLYAQLATALSAAGYTLVDTVVISTRTHKIWMSPAAGNAANKDWYVDITYPTTGGGDITFMPMEFFDPATDLAYRAPYMANSAIIDATTGSRWGSTGHTLEHANLTYNTSTATMHRLITAATSFGYWISVTPNRIVGMTSQLADRIVYVGLYEPLALYSASAGAELFPLCALALDGGAPYGAGNNTPASSRVNLTRIAPINALTGQGWNGLFYIRPEWTGANINGHMLPGLPADPTTLTNGGRYATRLLLQIASTVAQAGNVGGVLGYLGRPYDVLAMRAAATVVRGDTVSVGGQLWTLCSSSGAGDSQGSVLFRAA